jgi:hypothetical protein
VTSTARSDSTSTGQPGRHEDGSSSSVNVPTEDVNTGSGGTVLVVGPEVVSGAEDVVT